MKRRDFMQISASVALGTTLGCQTSKEVKKIPIGLQLYTLRDQLEQDIPGTLSAVQELGYSYVEGAGYDSGKFYGMPPKELAGLLNDLGMTMTSSHVDHGVSQVDNTTCMVRGFEQALEDAKSMGVEYMVLAWLAEADRQKLDDYRAVSALLNRCGELSKQYGIQMAYHNHDFELIALEGELPYDVLIRETDPELVKFEVDHYWFRKAGVNPFPYFKTSPGRFPLWHVKDMSRDESQDFMEVGKGAIDWNVIFDMADLSGMQYFFVEQDKCKRPPLESIEISYGYLEELLQRREAQRKTPLH